MSTRTCTSCTIISSVFALALVAGAVLLALWLF